MATENGLSGLQNMGNTCYMNTLIQCLSNCTLFRNYILGKNFVEPMIKKIESEQVVRNKKIRHSLIFQLFRVIKGLWRKDDCVLVIKTFKNLFGEKIKQFYGYAQQDSQEALNSLFMSIENELNYKIDGEYDVFDEYNNVLTPQEKLFILNLKHKYYEDDPLAKRIINGYTSWCDYNKKNNNVIMDLFTGYFHCETICPDCETISDKYESFNCMPISIVLKKDADDKYIEQKKEKDDKKDNVNGPIDDDEKDSMRMKIEQFMRQHQVDQEDVDVYSCFDNFYKSEKLDDNNKWYCPECKEKVNAERKFYIWKKPKILIVMLKRFDYVRQNKTSNKVVYPLKGLNMEKYMSKLSNIDDRKYNLFAVSNHIGNMNGGHYFSYCLNGNKWYEFNDETVTVLESDIITKKSYVLFYELE